MVFLEAEVHSSLQAFLRSRDQPVWTHHLTMARLVSRALRVQRSALIQTGSTVKSYCLSYLTPALLSNQPLLLVIPEAIQERLLQVEIPQLKAWLETDKEICWGDRSIADDFQGLMLTSPQSWFCDRLEHQGRFPAHIPTLIDQANALEDWAREYLTVTLKLKDWQQLRQDYPQHAESIRDVRIQLTKAIFNRPKNPYECYLLEAEEQAIVEHLWEILKPESPLISPFDQFWQRWQTENQLTWASINREKGNFSLSISPIEVASFLSPIWHQQPVVLIGGFLDAEKSATTYRQQIGLADVLCLKFSPNRQNEHIQLYLPERLPLPNTPQFQGVLIEQVYTLVSLCVQGEKPIIILVEDVPLKAQVGTFLAAEFGSKVQVEKTELANDGILICGWNFWHTHQDKFPTPKLLIIATLPIPSLEDPLVAGRVTYYKHQRQDWFRLYLLPTALKEIQQAVMPLRESQGIVALLDNRVNFRSYGNKILTALEPYAKINYLDASWFS